MIEAKLPGARSSWDGGAERGRIARPRGRGRGRPSPAAFALTAMISLTIAVTAACSDDEPSAPATSGAGGAGGETATDGCEGERPPESSDCAALVAWSGELTEEQCERCQGRACGEDADCDGRFPCAKGVVVIRACCADAQCEGLSLFCGFHTGTNRVCVPDDDV